MRILYLIVIPTLIAALMFAWGVWEGNKDQAIATNIALMKLSQETDSSIHIERTFDFLRLKPTVTITQDVCPSI